MTAEKKLISTRFVTRAAVARFIGPALLLYCSAHSTGVLAQARVVVDLPLPPATSSSVPPGDSAPAPSLARYQDSSQTSRAAAVSAQKAALISNLPPATTVPLAESAVKRTSSHLTPALATPAPSSAAATPPSQGARSASQTRPVTSTASASRKPSNRRTQSAAQPQPPGTKALDARLRKGDSLYIVFRRHGLNQGDLINMINSSKAIDRRLRRMRPGQKLRFDMTQNGRISRLLLITPGPTDIAIERQSATTFSMQTLADSAGPRARRKWLKHVQRMPHQLRTRRSRTSAGKIHRRRLRQKQLKGPS